MSPSPCDRSNRIPSSRAYWELKAEQVMHRVFAPEPSIDLEIIEARPQPPLAEPLAKPEPKAQHRANAVDQRAAMAAGVSVMMLGVAGVSAAGWGVWIQHQQALQQERNLLLIERLRNLPSTDPNAETTTSLATVSGNTGLNPQLPPPPPNEPWMQELTTLPSSSAPAAKVLQVPMSSNVNAAPTPVRSGAPTGSSSTNHPQLVGVIQIPGQGSSAIFQLDGASTSASAGENIGNSGWRLLSATGDSAVIQRGNEQRRISISDNP